MITAFERVYPETLRVTTRRPPRVEPFVFRDLRPVEISEAINLCGRLRSSGRIRDIEASAIDTVLGKVQEVARDFGLEQLARKRADRRAELLSREVLERDAEIAELKRAGQVGHNED